MLKETEFDKGGRRKNRLQDATSFNEQTNTTLKELGIEKTQSHRWQTLADMPKEVFEKHIADRIENKEELTSSGIYREAKKIKLTERIQSIKNNPIKNSDLDINYSESLRG